MDQRIANLLEMLRDIEDNGSVNFVLGQARFMTRKDSKKPDSERETYVYPRKTRDLLAELQSDIMDASLEFSLQEIELFRTPALLVEGEAGIGKSHIIAREVQRHVQQGHPAVFVPGRTLDQGDKPESEILHYLDLKDLRFETFLGALDAAAKADGRLRGRKHLIIGNHDVDKKGNLHPALAALDWADRPSHALRTKDGGRDVYMSHYAARVWPSSHHGAVHFYGHSHGRLPGHGLSRDVGVDCPDVAYAPRTFSELTKGMI
ncbi:MAG: hypothetical protein ACT6RF_11595 [Allorhizobium sp.]|uniref:hypothetical protein n=1 Tax=Allorhizobium sp. TaxID=633478 RepID=UPI004033C856